MDDKSYEIGWHIIHNGRLGYDDTRKVKRESTLKMESTEVKGKIYNEPDLCYAGMHASKSIIGAMLYRPLTYGDPSRICHLCTVKVWGDIEYSKSKSKFCGWFRKIINMVDAKYLVEAAEKSCPLSFYWQSKQSENGVFDFTSFGENELQRIWEHALEISND